MKKRKSKKPDSAEKILEKYFGGGDSRPLSSEWRHNQGYLCCGTLRIAVMDFDTDPTEARKKEIFDWIVATLNAAKR